MAKLLMVGARQKEITINTAYQCEQDQNWNMIIAEMILLLTGS